MSTSVWNEGPIVKKNYYEFAVVNLPPLALQIAFVPCENRKLPTARTVGLNELLIIGKSCISKNKHKNPNSFDFVPSNVSRYKNIQ